MVCTRLLLKSTLTCLVVLLATPPARAQQDPKQTPENTISIELAEPAKAQQFSRPLKFFVADTIDRSGNAQPMLVLRPRGGIYLDRKPTEIVKQALEQSLKAADMLAPDADSADYLLTVYVFHFGLGQGSGLEFFGKLDLGVMVKDPKSGKSQQVTAMGTSIQGVAVRKKNILKNVKANLEEALQDGLRNLLRGQKLRDAVEAAALPAGGRA